VEGAPGLRHGRRLLSASEAAARFPDVPDMRESFANRARRARLLLVPECAASCVCV